MRNICNRNAHCIYPPFQEILAPLFLTVRAPIRHGGAQKGWETSGE